MACSRYRTEFAVQRDKHHVSAETPWHGRVRRAGSTAARLKPNSHPLSARYACAVQKLRSTDPTQRRFDWKCFPSLHTAVNRSSAADSGFAPFLRSRTYFAIGGVQGWK